jgi:hypothetical protein
MSLYERVVKIIESMQNIESDAAAIDTLVFELRPLLRAQGVLFPVHVTQAVRIDNLVDYIMIYIYLLTIEIWVKIYKDDTTSIYIYPIQRCECG